MLENSAQMLAESVQIADNRACGGIGRCARFGYMHQLGRIRLPYTNAISEKGVELSGGWHRASIEKLSGEPYTIRLQEDVRTFLNLSPRHTGLGTSMMGT